MEKFLRISRFLPATKALLLKDVFLILLHAARIPPHILLSVNGKIFTLTVNGATVDGELSSLLRFIHKKKIETIFIRLALPAFFTMKQLKNEIRSCILAYPRADIGIATCLTPIRDFCHSVYDTEIKNINLIFDLLPALEEKNVLRDCYQMHLEKYLSENSFSLKKYEVNDVYEAIRKSSLAIA